MHPLRLGLRPLDFMVFGCPKSGTTWLRRMLTAHPQAHCAELRPFGSDLRYHSQDDFHITLDRYVDMLMWMADTPPDDGALYHATLDNTLAAIVETLRLATGKPIVGDKHTPFEGHGVLALERAARHNPAMTLIHLVRDPRDVLVSGFVHHARKRRPADPDSAAQIDRAIAETTIPDEVIPFWISRWTECVDAAAQNEHQFARSATVRYEDLLAEGSAALIPILNAIGADHDLATADACLEAASFAALSGGRAAGTEDRSSFFRKGVAGDWQRWLTDAQNDSIVRTLGDRLERFGYLSDPAPAATSSNA